MKIAIRFQQVLAFGAFAIAALSLYPFPAAHPAGVIEGTVNCACSGPVPSQRVYALRVDAQQRARMVVTEVGTGTDHPTFRFTDLPPGTYNVISVWPKYPQSSEAGYTKAVPCGLSVNCTDHSLLPIDVLDGQRLPASRPRTGTRRRCRVNRHERAHRGDERTGQGRTTTDGDDAS